MPCSICYGSGHNRTTCSSKGDPESKPGPSKNEQSKTGRSKTAKKSIKKKKPKKKARKVGYFSLLWRQLWISRMNSKFFDKNIQNLSKSYLIFQWICRILQVFKRFWWIFQNKSTKYEKSQGILKKKETQGFNKNSEFWRQCASGCLPKIGQKNTLAYDDQPPW